MPHLARFLRIRANFFFVAPETVGKALPRAAGGGLRWDREHPQRGAWWRGCEREKENEAAAGLQEAREGEHGRARGSRGRCLSTPEQRTLANAWPGTVR